MSDPAGQPLGAYFAEAARRRPHDLAVVAYDGVATWAELNRRANRLAWALKARGVTAGEFVTIALPSGKGFVEAAIACWKLGAVPQPAPAKTLWTELAEVVALANSAAVIREAPMPGEARSVSPANLFAACDDERDPPDHVAPSIKASLSGGSTGKPKLIVSTRPGVVDPGAATLYGLTAESVLLIPAPLYHNGPFSAAFGGLFVGARVVLMPKFEPVETLRLVERERATWIYLVPTMMSRIWRLDPAERLGFDVSSLKAVWHMAAPCAPWLKAAWIDWLGAERVFEIYGGAESQALTVVTGQEWLDHRGSVGRVRYGEICILDAEGRAAPPGEVGEIYMRPTPAMGQTYRYIGAQARRRGDWESLGDMGWMDADGFLYIADRRADMILVGGANVYPAEVEAAIEAHPLVQSCAVVGLPDDDLGNLIHAVVQPRDGLDLADLERHLAQRLSPAKRPKTFELASEPVRDDAGKVRRAELRARRLAVVK